MEVKEKEPQKTRVLFVDDSQGQIEIWRSIFRRWSVSFDSADSADEAVKKLEEGETFSHIIVDGLRGRWKEVVEIAKDRGVSNIFVHSSEKRIEDDVTAAGVQFILKDPKTSYDKFKEIFSREK